jgi:hypothetical protein
MCITKKLRWENQRAKPRDLCSYVSRSSFLGVLSLYKKKKEKKRRGEERRGEERRGEERRGEERREEKRREEKRREEKRREEKRREEKRKGQRLSNLRCPRFIHQDLLVGTALPAAWMKSLNSCLGW